MHIDLFGAGLLQTFNLLKIGICEKQKCNKVKYDKMRDAYIFLIFANK